MKSFHLRFCVDNKIVKKLHHGTGWYDNPDYEIFDLLNEDVSEVPAESGVYVFGTADGTMLVYPWSTSPIFYIGESVNLRRRIKEHKEATEGAAEDEYRWRSRYQFAAAFGAHCVWYCVDKTDRKQLEAHMIDSFFWRHGAIPVANGTDEWNKL